MSSTSSSTATSSGVVYDVTTNSLLGVTTSYDVTITDPGGTELYSGSIVPGVTGDVVAGSGFSLSIANALVGGTYVVPAGTTGSVNIAVSLGTLVPTTIYVGGDATISSGVTALSGLELDVDGGVATLNSGLVASALSGTTVNVTNGGTFSNGVALISALSGTTINFGAGGGTFVLNAGGTVLNLSSTTITGYDPSKDTISLEDTTDPISGYTISGSGTSRTVNLFGSDGTQVASYTVGLADGVTLEDGTYNAQSTNSSDNPLQITYSNGNTYIGACFLAGSMIRTPGGDVRVEDLRAGDNISVFDWRKNIEISRAVVWVGSQKAMARVHGVETEALYPVRVLKGAISDGVPAKDMLITSEHCLFLEDRLIPVRMLVNGRSIFYDKTIDSYTYYHIETDVHSVIWADGMPTESYLDTGNRSLFIQHDNIVLFSRTVRSWEKDAAASLDVTRDTVEPLYRRIDERARLAGIKSTAPKPVLSRSSNLHLVTQDGTVIRRVRETGRATFMIPAGCETIRIVSRTSRPCDTIGPFVDDRRELGVLVGEMTLLDSGIIRPLDDHLTRDRLDGWDVQEAGACRWTNGNALVLLGKRLSDSTGILSIEIKAAGPYPVESGFTATREVDPFIRTALLA